MNKIASRVFSSFIFIHRKSIFPQTLSFKIKTQILINKKRKEKYEKHQQQSLNKYKKRDRIFLQTPIFFMLFFFCCWSNRKTQLNLQSCGENMSQKLHSKTYTQFSYIQHIYIGCCFIFIWSAFLLNVKYKIQLLINLFDTKKIKNISSKYQIILLIYVVDEFCIVCYISII